MALQIKGLLCKQEKLGLGSQHPHTSWALQHTSIPGPDCPTPLPEPVNARFVNECIFKSMQNDKDIHCWDLASTCPHMCIYIYVNAWGSTDKCAACIRTHIHTTSCYLPSDKLLSGKTRNLGNMPQTPSLNSSHIAKLHPEWVSKNSLQYPALSLKDLFRQESVYNQPRSQFLSAFWTEVSSDVLGNVLLTCLPVRGASEFQDRCWGGHWDTQMFFQGYVSLEKILPSFGEVFYLKNWKPWGNQTPNWCCLRTGGDGSRALGPLFLLCTIASFGAGRGKDKCLCRYPHPSWEAQKRLPHTHFWRPGP